MSKKKSLRHTYTGRNAWLEAVLAQLNAGAADKSAIFAMADAVAAEHAKLVNAEAVEVAELEQAIRDELAGELGKGDELREELEAEREENKALHGTIKQLHEQMRLAGVGQPDRTMSAAELERRRKRKSGRTGAAV